VTLLSVPFFFFFRIPITGSFGSYLGSSDPSNEFNTQLTSIVADPLPCPNPFRLNKGTTLYYQLNRDASIRIFLYDFYGNEITVKHYSKGEEGGSKGLNQIPLNLNTVGFALPSGVYFLLIQDAENNIIGQSELAILP